jgi:hypothetical protein
LTLSGGASVSGGSDIDFINDAGSITLSNDTGVLLAHGTLTGLTLAGNTAGTSVVYNSITAGGLNVDAPATGLLVSENNLSSLALNAASQGGITGNNINGGGMAIDAAFTGSIDHNLIHGATVGVTYSPTKSTTTRPASWITSIATRAGLGSWPGRFPTRFSPTIRASTLQVRCRIRKSRPTMSA